MSHPGPRGQRRRWVGAILVAGAVGVAGCGLVGGSSTDCDAEVSHPEWSVARRWNEVALDAIRRDLPAPTVHARNLYHTSAAMWDAWAAFDPDARGVFVDEDFGGPGDVSDRDEAISYAAYRVLEARYLDSIGATETIPELDALMASLCLPIDVVATDDGTPAALGNHIAAVILEEGLSDGSNEADGYASPSYAPVNPPLIVDASGTEMVDPNRWQPLRLANMVSQNGIALQNGVQEAIDPHWGFVTSFAMPPAPTTGVPIDPGPPPHLGDPPTDKAFKDGAIEVIRYSSLLDPTPGTILDASPASMGDNTLGTNDGTGYALNPSTGQPYEPNQVNLGDFGRTVAEFWADGPHSETPPGHWNTIANSVGDSLGEDLTIGESDAVVDRLEWDVKTYLALNGANHDAAIAAWGAKGWYDYVRPISMIRYMGGLGQSSEPSGQSFHPDGLPLVEGLIEVVTDETTIAGGRHAGLAGHEGEIAIYAYRGNPDDPDAQIGGVGWILAVDWVPYQAPTFVTPSFPAYVSGHSSFSRASAEVLTAITNDPFFPGGLGIWDIPADDLRFEAGTDNGVELQWATYRDASDQAGLSRLYGGIHVRADDFAGRIIGEHIGQAAWAKAASYFGDGSGS